jgi:hypothetical protein
MDEAAGFLVEAIAKTVAEARKRQERAAAALAPLAPRAPAGTGGIPGAPPKAVPVRAARTADIPPRREEPSPPADEPRRAPDLLQAFRGGPSLIGAFILAEALAPPIALRQK